jgi:hypothetical protein
MNRSGNMFFWLCAALLLAAEMGRAQTVYWSDGFETNVPSRWTATGAWHIGSPTAGPAKNPSGYRTHSGANCASTQNYSYNQDGRIVCTKYLNGSNSLVVPDASVSPTLIFWHWVNLANALGYVELKSGTNDWQQISSTYLNVTSGGVWVQNSIDLSAFAGQNVQIAFHFTSGGCCGNAEGWYVDDVSLTVVPVIVVSVPPTQTIYAGQPLDVTISATNSLYPTNALTFTLVSPPKTFTNLNLNPVTGELTWQSTTAQPPSTNTINVKVTDSVSHLSTTTNFIVQVLRAQPPVLTVPSTQTIYAGLTMDVTLSATSVYENSLFTFALVSPTNLNLDVSDLQTDGVLKWTPNATNAGSHTITVMVSDSASLLTTTTNFVVVVSTNSPPPTLNVLPTQKIYAGQTVTVTNTAMSVFPSDTFTFTQLSGPTNNVVLNATNGVLIWIWATMTNQPAGTTNVTIQVVDSEHISTNKSFLIVVWTNPPPPMLIVPPTQTIYAGQTLIVTNSAYYTNSVFLGSSAFSFATKPPTPTGVILVTTNDVGVLTWATTIAQPAGTYTNAITVTDSLSGFSATSNFLVQVLPPLPPILIVPSTQMIYAGQTMDVTFSATNSAYTNCTFTFAAFGPTNMDVSNLPKNGVLKWTPLAAQAPSANTIYVKVTDNNSLSTISNFLVLVLTTPPPGLMVPPTQTLTIKGFQFTLNTMPNTTWRIDASTNLLSWLPLLTNTADSSGTIPFIDSRATNYPRRFYRAVLQ